MTVNQTQGQIQEADDFADDKKGKYQRWEAELQASFDATNKWHRNANKVVNRFLDRRGAGEEDWFKLNLFNANITTQRAMLFGRLPEVDISRANNDYDDDVGRVATIILKRLLQNDIGTPNDEYSDTLRMNLDDRLIAGLGVGRVRYEFDQEEKTVAARISMEGKVLAEGFSEDVVTAERAPIDYVHWRDFAWSPARTWAEVRWVAFRAHLTRDQLKERFGDEVGAKIPLEQSQITKDENMWVEKDDPKQDAWSRAEIWEIWDKQSRKVYWLCKNYPTLLDENDDHLGLL